MPNRTLRSRVIEIQEPRSHATKRKNPPINERRGGFRKIRRVGTNTPRRRDRNEAMKKSPRYLLYCNEELEPWEGTDDFHNRFVDSFKYITGSLESDVEFFERIKIYYQDDDTKQDLVLPCL